MSLTTHTPSAAGAAAAFNVIPSGAALAAQVTGIDLRYLDDRAFGPKRQRLSLSGSNLLRLNTATLLRL
jgi:hypothetical protein